MRQEDARARFGQNLAQRPRRHVLGAAPREGRAERRPGLKYEPGRGAHQSRNRARGSDEGGEVHRRARPVRQRAQDRCHSHEDQKPHRAEAPRDRRPEGYEPDGVEQDVRPRAVQKGVGQERPQHCSAAHRAQFPHRLRLLERGGVGFRADQEGDRPCRPVGNGQPPGHESQVANDEILERRTRPGECGIERHQKDRQNDDDRGDIEHRLARPASRFHFVHMSATPFVRACGLEENSTERKRRLENPAKRLTMGNIDDGPLFLMPGPGGESGDASCPATVRHVPCTLTCGQARSGQHVPL